MIKSILICDSQGFPFYSKKLDFQMEEIEPAIFSGLISAIGAIGKQIFNEDIATITYGSKYQIIIVTRNFLSNSKSIYFVFLVEGDIDIKLIKRISTHIFIETKQVLKDRKAESFKIDEKIDTLLMKFF